MSNLKLKLNRMKLKAEKHSPEILMGFGALTFLGTIYTASKAGLKAREVLGKYHEEKADIHEACEEDENYAVSVDKRNDLLGTYGRAAIGVTKAYAPTIALGSLSLGCFLTANHILKGRYLVAVSAYNAVSGAFETYRKRVREEEGVEADRHYMFGTRREQITETVKDEKGRKKEEVKEVELMAAPGEINGEYIRYLEEGNKIWDPDPGIMFMTLRAQQSVWNNVLHTRGHVFLNDVLDALGFPQTQIGAVVGWVMGNGDNYIDFGINDDSKPMVRKFINGEENVILLEFNCDGMILDKI